ncbi:tRNA (adenine-N(1))-methyltransferase [Bacillus sp. ISL-47]|uniref:tRNA (adenine(22)-N(1))-methyltransferase n=1 Tax=Bacillus sp. ISL-47 TaxID=2819130 RepID=UPI001BE6447B|nr:tRNA (adenine(22)-N(1))-methyltransferase TrmK [Bacillus sp. ISL-47]MBT2690445.1 tRNA (adenine-N(1))-methyltransferase [Bacillus sp. ISL-47]MBT2710154.1 tRNA (adenine-N(1))-methyltransferase [Pseudomonas sp. ISL-84]
MNTDKLSQRLEAVTNYIPSGARLADIGSDHAYLPCYAVKKGIVPFAIAGEVVEGPFQSAKRQVEMEELVGQISVRKGNGLEVINHDEVDCITIAGMGGALIAAILEEGKSKLSSVQRLVLQPNLSAISIRTWLIEHGWELIAEEILEEDGKIYEILAAEKGEALKPYKNAEQGLLMGPFLMEEKSAVFQTKWLGELRNWERILMQLGKAADTEETEKRKKELKQKIKMVEGVLYQ